MKDPSDVTIQKGANEPRTTNDDQTEEAKIRALIDDRVVAVRSRDVRRTIDAVAPDIVAFDVVNRLRRTGSGYRGKTASDRWTDRAATRTRRRRRAKPV
jgi:ketosteroid isomerase-like protein